MPLNPANAYNDIVANTSRDNFNGSGIYVRARPLPITNPHRNTTASSAAQETSVQSTPEGMDGINENGRLELAPPG